MTQFMTGIFKVPDPSEARGNSITAREILDKASKEIDTSLQNDPELQAKMMVHTWAQTYADLGIYLARAAAVRASTGDSAAGYRTPSTRIPCPP